MIHRLFYKSFKRQIGLYTLTAHSAPVGRNWNKDTWFSRIGQPHRCGHRQAACREPAGSYDKTTRTAICFEHKTQYLLIRAPYTRIVVFGTSVKYPPWLGCLLWGLWMTLIRTSRCYWPLSASIMCTLRLSSSSSTSPPAASLSRRTCSSTSAMRASSDSSSSAPPMMT